MPKTLPSLVIGNYTLWVDHEIVGYFRQFASALKWRDYLAATTEARQFWISHKGTTIYAWKRPC